MSQALDEVAEWTGLLIDADGEISTIEEARDFWDGIDGRGFTVRYKLTDIVPQIWGTRALGGNTFEISNLESAIYTGLEVE